MTRQESERLVELVPGTEARWEAYRLAREPYDRACHHLQQGSAESLDDALTFLSERPRFHGSGYLTERVLRFLSRPSLSARDLRRVIDVAESIADEGHTREAYEARRLLARLRAKP